MSKISIILPLYNSEKFVEECLDSLLNQTFKDYELIILDDCSKDKTRNILDKKKIKYYTNKRNLGPVKNLNKGIKIAKGDYIMITDHDMVYDKNYLKEMMLEKKEIMSARCYYYKSKRIRSFGISVNLLTGKTTANGKDKIDSGEFDFITEIKFGGAGTLMIKKEVFKKINFDESFNKYYVDADFCYKARKKGFKTFLSKAKCWHKKEKKNIFNEQQLEKYYEDKKLFLKKHSLCYFLSLIPIKSKKFIKFQT